MSELQATKAADAWMPDRLAAVSARVRLTARVGSENLGRYAASWIACWPKRLSGIVART